MLDRADVDTDQIIPKQFLKRVERTGFGEFLFYDWIRDGEIELEPNPILVAGRNFGCGSSREHAPWALQDFGFRRSSRPRSPTSSTATAPRSGCCRSILDEEHCRAVAEAGEARIDLDDQTVDSAGGVVRFEIDEEIKHRLLTASTTSAMTLQNGRRSTRSRPPARADRGPGDDGARERVSDAGPDWDARDLRPGRGARRRSGGVRCSTGSSSRRRDRRSTPAAAAAGSPQLLLERLPEGRVIGVDGSQAMIEQGAREPRRPGAGSS